MLVVKLQYRQPQTTAIGRGWTMTVSDYVVIPNNWRNATVSRAQLQTAWSKFSKRDIDTRHTPQGGYFTGTWVCLLTHRRPRKLRRSRRSALVGSRRIKQNVEDSLLCSAAARLLQRECQRSSDHTWSDSSYATFEKFDECSVGNVGKTINSSQSKTCEQDYV